MEHSWMFKFSEFNLAWLKSQLTFVGSIMSITDVASASALAENAISVKPQIIFSAVKRAGHYGLAWGEYGVVINKGKILLSAILYGNLFKFGRYYVVHTGDESGYLCRLKDGILFPIFSVSSPLLRSLKDEAL